VQRRGRSLATKSAQRCSIRKMKTKTILCVVTVAFAAVAASIWLGYHQGGTSTNSPPLEGSSPPMTNGPSREYKTVEREFSRDSAISGEQINQQMQAFADEGWAVASASAPLPQPDGTIHRKFEVSRAK
jgi:hypothetical protein